MIADTTHISESKVSGGGVMDLHIAVFDADANQSQNLAGLIGKLGLTWYGPPGHLVPTVVERSAYPDQGIDDLDVFVLSGVDSLVSHVPDVLFIATELGGTDDAIRVVSGLFSDRHTTQIIFIVPSDVSVAHGHTVQHVGFFGASHLPRQARACPEQGRSHPVSRAMSAALRSTPLPAQHWGDVLCPRE